MVLNNIWCNTFGRFFTPSYCQTKSITKRQKGFVNSVKSARFSYGSSAGGKKRTNNYDKTKRNKNKKSKK